MFVNSCLLLASLLVSQTIGIVLPNGFNFDESLYTQQLQSKPAAVPQSCSQNQYSQCTDDCSSVVYCDSNLVAYAEYDCPSYAPYCAKNQIMCSSNFPMSSENCLNKAYNNFICTSDGTFPDPMDCTKYHVCSGKTHTIQECPASHIFWHNQTYGSSGSGKFACQFRSLLEACAGCNSFSCDGASNMTSFRSGDNNHYAFCLDLSPTFKKTLLFKCPEGTVHSYFVGMNNQVECVAPTPFV